MRLRIILSVFIGLAAACMPTVPTVPPEVSVVVTVVDDQGALNSAVQQALTATADRGIYATETALAQAGITLTPSPTNTSTPSPVPPSPTPIQTPTVTLTPTNTIEPSATALASNTPNPNVEPVNGVVRVIDAWKSKEAGPVDVFIDELPVTIGLNLGEATGYQQVLETNVRVRIDPAGINQLVSVPQGHTISVVLADLGDGPTLISVDEDSSSLPSGKARVTFLQADSNLLRVNIFEETRKITLLHDFEAGDIGGPFDLSAGNLRLSLADAEMTDQILSQLGAIQLDSHIDHLVIFVPGEQDTAFAPDMLVFRTGTQINPSDRAVRLINAAQAAGPIDVEVDGNLLVTGLAVGDATVPLPMSRQGATLTVQDRNGEALFQGPVGPQATSDDLAEWLLLIADAPQAGKVNVTVIERKPRASSALANVRLIHGLSGATNTLDLEMRASNAQQINNPIGVPAALQADSEWSKVISDVSFGVASAYALRSPNVFDARVVLSSTGAVQATIQNIGLLAGGTYDFVAVPGPQAGVTRILVLEPSPQVSILAMQRDDPQLVEDRVNATLTAVAPAVTKTVVQARTPTPTISPVPTNTPRPTSTPRLKPPSLLVDPAPPDTVVDSFILTGEGFTPRVRYTVSLDNDPELLSGRVGADGTISITVQVTPGLAAGAHVVHVCADCRAGGAQQAVFAVFLVPDPNITSTATPGL